MKTRLFVLSVVLVLLVSFGVGTRPAQAAGAASASVGCSVITISGTTDGEFFAPTLGPAVIIIITYDPTNTVLFDDLVFVDIPQGHYFSLTFHVPESTRAKEGDQFHIQVIDFYGIFFDVHQACSDAFQGPGIPSGFVLKTVTCSVAVFDAPGGKPVGDNRIKAGQNWFVNPTPVKDSKGKSWTEVFVGGYSNGFVPTSCVQ